jgi:hypothetical protein
MASALLLLLSETSADFEMMSVPEMLFYLFLNCNGARQSDRILMQKASGASMICGWLRINRI